MTNATSTHSVAGGWAVLYDNKDLTTWKRLDPDGQSPLWGSAASLRPAPAQILFFGSLDGAGRGGPLLRLHLLHDEQRWCGCGNNQQLINN